MTTLSIPAKLDTEGLAITLARLGIAGDRLRAAAAGTKLSPAELDGALRPFNFPAGDRLRLKCALEARGWY